MSEMTVLARTGGMTKRYQGNGRGLGYPTANISSKTRLKDGIYFGFANLGEYKRRPALIFVGTPVTVGDKERRVEAHLLDIPDTDYYDQKLMLEIRHFHRPNQKFGSVVELMEAIKADEAAGRKWFEEN